MVWYISGVHYEAVIHLVAVPDDLTDPGWIYCRIIG